VKKVEIAIPLTTKKIMFQVFHQKNNSVAEKKEEKTNNIKDKRKDKHKYSDSDSEPNKKRNKHKSRNKRDKNNKHHCDYREPNHRFKALKNVKRNCKKRKSDESEHTTDTENCSTHCSPGRKMKHKNYNKKEDDHDKSSNRTPSTDVEGKRRIRARDNRV